MGNSHHASFAGPGIMIISALIFGYFGFSPTYSATGVNGQFLVYVPILEWTLKISAVAFALSAVLTFLAPLLGNVLYSIIGLLGAIAFVVVAIMDYMDPQHTVMNPLILLAFAAFNGYGSWQGIRAVVSAMARDSDAAAMHST